MSYTNKTPNYNLPQYTADDKPTYLGDFNTAMLNLDTAIKNVDNVSVEAKSIANNSNLNSQEALNNSNQAVQDVATANNNASNALTIAQNAQTQASNAETISSTANANASSAKTTSEQAQVTANEAVSTANSSKSSIEALMQQIANWFFGSIKNTDLSASSVNICYNKTLGLLNIYGYVDSINNKQLVIGTLPEFIRPTTNIAVQGGCSYANASGVWQPCSMYILTDGSIKVPSVENFENMTNLRFNCMLCVNNPERWNPQNPV